MIKNTYLLFLLLLFGITGVMAQTVQIENVVKAPGDILVPVDMLGFTSANGNVQAIQLQISFDNALLSFQGITNVNSNFSNWVVPTNGASSPITLSYTNMTGHDINTKLLDLKFAYAGGFSGAVSFVTGGCEVVGASLTPMANVTYVNGSVTQATPVATVDLGVTQQASATSSVTVPVNMQGSGLFPFNALTFKVGYDPAKLTFVQTLNSVLGGMMVANAANGVVTVTWNGYIASLSDPKVFDLKFTYNGGGNASLEFKPGSQISSASLGLIPTTFVNGMVSPDPGTSTLTMPTLYGTLNSEVAVPITLNYTGSGYIGGVDLLIGYDNSILVFKGFNYGTITSSITASASGGVVHVIWNKSNNTSSLNGVLASLRFLCNANGTSPLTFNAYSTVTQTNLSNVTLTYTNGSLTVCSASITTQPSDVSVCYNTTATFNVVASNSCGYQWQVSTDGGSTWANVVNNTNYSGATTATLTIANTPVSFGGNKYRCFMGLVTSNAVTLSITNASISANPGNQTVNLGASTSFSITASCVATYQWQVSTDGGATFTSTVSGGVYSNVTTATLSIIGVTAAMNGYQYRCVVTPGGATSTAGVLTVNPLKVNVKVILQGPYNNAGAMAVVLRAKAYFPLAQPYNTAPWNYAGTESVASVPANVVDWVLVELRSGTASSTTVMKKAGFVLSDGSVVGTDGINPIAFSGLDINNYYIVVRHRNHLAIMSATAQPLSSTSALYDFTTGLTQAYGLSPMLLAIDGKAVMVGGDVNTNGTARANGPASVNDLTILINFLGASTLNVYSSYDVNLDGVARANGPSTVNDASKLSSYLGAGTYTSKVPN